MELIDILKGENYSEILGKSKQVSKVVSIFDGPFSDDTLTWVNAKNLQLLDNVRSGIVLTPVKPTTLNSNVTYVISESPRLLFKNVVDKIYPDNKKIGVDPTAFVHPGSKIGENSHIGHNVVIEENVIIGSNCQIGHNTVIKSGTIIGKNVTIGCNNTIGGVGFGYQKNDTGEYELIRHIGIVKIEDHVDIGNNTCIDRAVLGETLIERNSKIDNLVHIAHNVKIRSNSLIIANAMVAGSCEIGPNAWIAPSSSIINGVKVSADALVGLGAVVVKPVPEKAIVVGNPAKELKPKT